MKKTQIAILQGKSSLLKLDRYLSLIGFSVEFFSKPRTLLSSVGKSHYGLVLIDRELIDDESGDDLTRTLTKNISPLCKTLLVEEDGERFLFYDLDHNEVFHLFDLYEYLLQHLQHFSRKNLRVAVKLPSTISRDGTSQVTQISSLSAGGAFVRTGYPTPEEGETIEMTVPLIGHHAEIELRGRVVYNVLPSQENNYIQGVGVCFDKLDDSSTEKIKDYLYSYITNDVSVEETAKGNHHSGYLEPAIKKSLLKGGYLQSVNS